MGFKSYAEMVDYNIEHDSTEVFGNFSTEHASHIVTRFLENAKKTIIVLSGSFVDVTPTQGMCALLRQTALRLKENNGSIRIITADGNKNSDIEKICSEIKNKDSFDYIPAKYAGHIPLKHFMVVDEKMYRLENAHEKNIAEGADVHAEVCCNGKEKAAQLIEFFDHVWNILDHSRSKQQEV